MIVKFDFSLGKLINPTNLQKLNFHQEEKHQIGSLIVSENLPPMQPKTSFSKHQKSTPQQSCPGHRSPLVNPSREHLLRVRERLENLRWWPIIGCGD